MIRLDKLLYKSNGKIILYKRVSKLSEKASLKKRNRNERCFIPVSGYMIREPSRATVNEYLLHPLSPSVWIEQRECGKVYKLKALGMETMAKDFGHC